MTRIYIAAATASHHDGAVQVLEPKDHRAGDTIIVFAEGVECGNTDCWIPHPEYKGASVWHRRADDNRAHDRFMFKATREKWAVTILTFRPTP